MSDSTIIDWDDLIESHQQLFTGSDIEKSIDYLKTSRQSGKGWGLYQHVGTNLSTSALVIQALLNSKDRDAVGTASDAATALRRTYQKQIDQSGFEEIQALLAIDNVEQRPDDDDYTQLLVDRLLRLSEEQAFLQTSSTLALASSILLLRGTNLPVEDSVKSLGNRLIERQMVTGAWSVIDGDVPNLVATSFALRSLSHLEIGPHREVVVKGCRYLESQLDELGWSAIGAKDDVFVQAHVLWALAELKVTDYACVRDGIIVLRGAANANGSWGSVPQGPASLEMTALCLLALIAAGENRYVAYRVAKSAVYSLSSTARRNQEELDRLRKNLKRSIQDEVGLVIKDRDNLLKENRRLKSEVDRATVDIQRFRGALERMEINEDARYRSQWGVDEVERPLSNTWLGKLSAYLDDFRVSLFTYSNIFMALLGIAGYYTLHSEFAKIVSLGVIGLLIVSTAFLTTRRIALRRMSLVRRDRRGKVLVEENIDPRVRNLRSMYLDMAMEWPTALREELEYRLFRELADAPPEIGLRFIEEFSFRLKMSPSMRSELNRWTRYVMGLSTMERRILFEQLIRTGRS